MVQQGENKKLHIFDVDGTIIDSHDKYTIEEIKFMRDNGLDLNNFEMDQYKDFKSTLTSPKEIARLIKNEYLHNMCINQIEFALKNIGYTVCSEIKIDSDAIKYIKTLKMLGHNIAIVTNNYRDNINILLKNNAVENLFDCIYTNDDYKYCTSYKNELFDKCVKEWSGEWEDVIIYEDTLSILDSLLENVSPFTGILIDRNDKYKGVYIHIFKVKSFDELEPVIGIGDINKVKQFFNNTYILKLSISDHLSECMRKYNRYKDHALDTFDKDTLEHELNKELMDLLILLEMYRDEILPGLYYDRLDKFTYNAIMNLKIQKKINIK